MESEADMRALAARFLELWQAQAEAAMTAAARLGEDEAGDGDGEDRSAAADGASRRR
ncbi:MAG: hypothetical protein QGF53_03300 [Alphaproteobacteria bacterium]|jgi:hypothetical protein|nr:hypothetical protein [Alphaproteobacteria bacterium]